MAEQEGEPIRKSKGKKEEEAPKKPEKKRGEEKGKEPSKEKKTVYEAGKDAKEADKGVERREKLLEKAVDQALKEKPEFKGAEKRLKDFIEFLKKKEKGEKIDKEEEASFFELLLALLKFIWKQIKEYLLDEEGEFGDLIKAAEAAGCKTPEEMVKWMFKGLDLSPGEEKRLEKAIKEAEEGKELEPEEVIALKGREPIPGVVSLPEDAEDLSAEGLPGKLQAHYKKKEKELEDLLDDIRRAQEAGDKEAVELLEGSLTKKHRELREIYSSISYAEQMLGEEREIAAYLGRMYGKEIKEIYNKMLDVEEAGVFKILVLDEEGMRQLADPSVLDEETFVLNITGKEVDLSKYTKRDMLVAEIKEFQSRPIDEDRIELFRDRLRINFVKPLFEEIISDAESDPREGFNMKGDAHILFGTMMRKLRDAGALGADEKRRFENLLWTRRIFSFLNSELIRGGDPEEIGRVSGKLLLSEDLDTIAVMEPSLTPALNVVERILARVRMDPKNKGQIPYDFLIPNPHGGYRPPEIERIVRGQLLAMDKARLVNLGKTKSEKEKEALRVAALAVKTSNVFYRSAEHVAQTQLAPRKMGEIFMSYPFDKVPVRLLRLGPERFETWGRGREGAKPWVDRINKYVQGGVYEEIPGEPLDEWKINFENYLQFGGPFSGSPWRSLVATEEQRSRGVALGVDLYDTKSQAKRLTRLEEKYDKAIAEAKEEMMTQVLGIKEDWDKAAKKADREELVKKALDVAIWRKVGERFPTVIARYFPTLSLSEAKSQDHYFDFEGRLRDGIILESKKKEFFDYVDREVKKKFEKEEIWKEIEEDVEKDIESKFIKEGDKKWEIERRTVQRKKELKLQVGAEASFNWMLAEQFGISTSKEDWEKEVFERWEVLQEKLTLYEEYALQRYVEDSEGYGKKCKEDDFDCRKKRDEQYKGVLELIGKDENLLNLEFSKEEKEIVRRLSNLGAREAREAVVGAERLAGVKFSFLPFMEDVIHERVEWRKIGPRGVSRRIGGDAKFVQETDAIMTKIDNGLFGPEDKVVAHRKELVKSFFEVYAAAQHLGEGDRQKVIAAKVDSILENLYKADWWTKLPLIGPLLDWGGPANLWKPYARSSNAQRKFGIQALSMTALERYQFINDLRPLIGNDRADKLLRSQKATLWRHVILELVSQWGPAVPLYFGGKWLSAFIKELQAYVLEQ